MTATYTLVGGVLERAVVRPHVTPPPAGLTQTESGLVYKTGFTDLTGWTNGGGWSQSSTPSLVTFGAFPLPVLGPDAGDNIEGIREPQLYIEDDVWWLLYDSGDGATGWRQFLASSDDRGLTWTRHGEIGASFNAYEAVATGWMEKRDGVYYLHRVGAEDTFGSPNVGLPGSPYRWDTWTAEELPGPWEYVGEQATVPGTWAASSYLPGCVVEDAGSYYMFAQGRGTTGPYRMGLAVAPSPTGPWTLNTTPLFSTTHFGPRVGENMKVFWHEGFARWVGLVNYIAASGQYTDRNGVLMSASLTDWSTAPYGFTQRNAEADGAAGTAVGVATHITGPDGALVHEGDYVPLVFDSDPDRYSPGWHLGRSTLATVLEPSVGRIAYSNASAVNQQLTRDLAHDDFEAEFAVQFTTGHGTNIGFWFRQQTGTTNGYRLVVRSNQPLLLQKSTGGTVTTVQTSSQNILDPGSVGRVRIKVEGSSIKAWLDGQLQIDTTEATYPTGDQIAFSGFAATGHVRLLSIRVIDNTVTVAGLDPTAEVVIRSYGGLPVAATTAVAGVATFTNLTHGPHGYFEIDGVDHPVEGGIWPGDSYTI